MKRNSIRVLVVDDQSRWCQLLSAILNKQPELQVVGQASNGIDALDSAKKLQPDLILLDIGLPKLNGFEAARQIGKVVPKSKILFVSQESSADVVQQAFSLGACGYVVKMDAGGELLTAVDAVLRGEQFVSSRFAGHDFTGVTNLRTADALSANAVHTSSNPPPPLRKAGTTHRHEANFYSDDESFLNGMTRFVGTALKAGSAVIVLATESHRESLLPRLQAHGIDVTAAVEQRRYIPFDSAEILSRFMLADVPDPIRFFELAADLIDKACTGTEGAPNRVVACGELAPLLLEQGKPESAIQLEQLWDQLVRKYSLDTLCAYSKPSFVSEPDKSVIQRICATHSAVHSL